MTTTARIVKTNANADNAFAFVVIVASVVEGASVRARPLLSWLRQRWERAGHVVASEEGEDEDESLSRQRKRVKRKGKGSSEEGEGEGATSS
ncbi:hypothetical protein OG21DRAFT_775811 [Imleria badia]|nr:hypothetical protein OG21DRAFT_775811 [Imleria badia]